MQVKEYVLGQYTPELDTIGPGFKDIQYPALVIMLEDGTYVVYDYHKLDKLFSAITGILAAKMNATKFRQKLTRGKKR